MASRHATAYHPLGAFTTGKDVHHQENIMNDESTTSPSKNPILTAPTSLESDSNILDDCRLEHHLAPLVDGEESNKALDNGKSFVVNPKWNTSQRNDGWHKFIPVYFRRSPKQAWRKLIRLACICAISILIFNIGILIWILSKPTGSYNDSRLVYVGDCNRSASIKTWSHLAINILSTILLAAGNYASQILLAPTREAIDIVHGKRRSFHIGVQSWSNWFTVGLRNKILLLILFLTTIPLHLLYNSTIYSTTSSIYVFNALVTSDYLTTPPKDTSASASPLSESQWQLASEGKLSNMISLTMPECWDTFKTAKYVNNYAGFLVVSNVSSNNYSYPGNPTVLTIEPKPVDNVVNPFDVYPFDEWTNGSTPTDWFDGYMEFSYCLAFEIDPSCTVETIPATLGVVIACNILKLLVLLYMIGFTFTPLITIGDAIASFMNCPDPTTEGMGPVSGYDFQTHTEEVPKQWRSGKERIYDGVSPWQFLWTLFLTVAFWLTGFGLEVATTSQTSAVSIARQWQDGFGTFEVGMQSSLQTGLIVRILVTNLPQLILSYIYVLFNADISCMVLTREWKSYSTKRKGLRVTSPSEQQRSTYFLSLPFKFSVPLIGISTLLHWLLSQSLFLEELQIYQATSQSFTPYLHPDADGSVHGIGYSTLALAVLLGLGGVLTIGLLVMISIEYHGEMPVVGTNSRAISAACHLKGDPTKKVQYGVVEGDRVGFTSEPVMPLEDGKYYT